MGAHHGLSLWSLPSWWAVLAFLLLRAAFLDGSFDCSHDLERATPMKIKWQMGKPVTYDEWPLDPLKRLE
jgi:hypothetical protein